MAKRSGWAWLLGASAFALFGGAALAASTTQQIRRKDGEEGGPDPDQSRRRDGEGGGPNPDQSQSEDDASAKAEAHKNGFATAARQFAEWGKQSQAEDAADRESAKVRNAAAGAIYAVGGAVATVTGPIAGPVIVLLATGIAEMVRAVKSWGGVISGGNRLEFTGWRDNSYHFRDVPIYGPEASRFWEICQRIAVRPEQLEALKTLIAAYPNGPDPSVVAISSTGDFDYLFNLSRPGDLSQAERDANRVYGMQVYSPADVTLRGPRGFDPQRPLGWKVPGERASVFDRVVKATGPAGGL